MPSDTLVLGYQFNIFLVNELSIFKDPTNLFISSCLLKIYADAFIKEIGSGNSLAVCPMDDAMHRIKEGVDKSSPSETKNVFPAAAE